MRKKRNDKKRGFTLIELLAVVAILAVIAVIIVPVVSGTIESSRKKAFTNSVYNANDTIQENLSSDGFAAFPESGIEASSITDLDKNPFIGGTFKKRGKNIYAIRVTDGRYCAVGTKENLRVAFGDCSLIDDTAPVSTLKINEITSNSVSVVVDAYDDESDIVGYQFSKDGGKTYTDIQESNSYTFTNLAKDTTFQIRAKVINAVELTAETDIVEVTTKNFGAPTFSSNPGASTWSRSKDITITYPTTVANLVYTYSLDNGTTWKTAASSTQKVTVNTKNVTILARVTDGVTTESASYTVSNIDDGKPTNVSLKLTGSTVSSLSVEATATASSMGIKGYYFSSDNGTTWKPIQTSNTYTFTELSVGTTYPLRVRVVGNNGEYADATLSATTLSQYTVTFNPNSGTVSPTSKAVNAGSAIGTLPTPTRSSYTFQGWYTQIGGGTKITTTQVIDNDVTYYARWYRNAVSASTTNSNSYKFSISAQQNGLNSVALVITMSNSKRSACGTGQFSYSCSSYGAYDSGASGYSYKFGVAGTCDYVYNGDWTVTMANKTISGIPAGSTINCTATFKSQNYTYFNSDVSVSTGNFTLGK